MARQALSGARGPTWLLDELAHAGPEHLDPDYVTGYDTKSSTDWSGALGTPRSLGICADSTVVDLGAGTGSFAAALAPHVARVIAVDVSQPMISSMRARGIDAVHAGFLGFEHDEPVDAVHTRNALHHLPDFWKGVSLHRIAQLLRPGGALLLSELVYSFEPGDTADAIEAWLAAAPTDPMRG